MGRAGLRLLAFVCAGLAASPVLSSLACEAPPEVSLTHFDAKRMAKFDTSRDRGLAEAGQAQSSDDRAILAEIFVGEEKLTQLPDGRYRCRTIKLGGLLPLVIYNYFDCAVRDNGTTIEKLTGSQRFIGSLTPSGDALFYAGALHYGDEQPMAYGADADRDQVGCIVRISGEDEKYRLEMPAPRRESTHDVIELVRR